MIYRCILIICNRAVQKRYKIDTPRAGKCDIMVLAQMREDKMSMGNKTLQILEPLS